MKLYTRRGDQGETSLLGGARVPKTDIRVKSYGAVDELQAHLGMARAAIDTPALKVLVSRVQQRLLTACAQLAATPEAARRLKDPLGPNDVAWLETEIDALIASYPLPARFVLPGEGIASAAAHVARTVCRRCERLLLMRAEQTGDDLHDLIVYFNRLSDFLFALAWALEVRHTIRDIVFDLIGKGGPCN